MKMTIVKWGGGGASYTREIGKCNDFKATIWYGLYAEAVGSKYARNYGSNQIELDRTQRISYR